MKNAFDVSLLKEIVRADFNAGLLYWNARDSKHFKRVNQFKCWNHRFANKEALNCVSPIGYKGGEILGSPMKAHRVIWALFYGEWPNGDIDHIDHNRSNNRIENLRIVSPAENKRNMTIYRNNKSGENGVHFHKRSKRWIAYINIGGKRHNLGEFTNKDEAIVARQAANSNFGFHSNHGGQKCSCA